MAYEATYIVLILDKTIIDAKRGGFDIDFSTATNNIINNDFSFSTIYSQSLISGINSFSYDSSSVPEWTFTTAYSLSSTASTFNFLNVTVFQYR